jgi:hypothetical protein
MLTNFACRIAVVAFSVTLSALLAARAWAQTPEPKQRAPSEAEVILQDSKKNDPETPKEIADCMQQWGRNTQMTKEEWAASCRRTLQYFPEKQ